MPNLEPTYLRYVYDGLNKGSLNAENASSLPHGFIEIYERDFNSKMSVSERNNLVSKFSFWVLLFKPLTLDSASKLFGCELNEMKTFIRDFSNWFNVSNNGKYEIYHQRFKLYILQKISENETSFWLNRILNSLYSNFHNYVNIEIEIYAYEYIHKYYELLLNYGENNCDVYELISKKQFWDKQLEKTKNSKSTLDCIRFLVKDSIDNGQSKTTVNLLLNYLHYKRKSDDIEYIIEKSLISSDYENILENVKSFDHQFRLRVYLFIIEHTVFRDELKCFDIIEKVIYEINHDSEFRKLSWSNFYSEKILYSHYKYLIKKGVDISSLWSLSRLDSLEIYDYDFLVRIQDIVDFIKNYKIKLRLIEIKYLQNKNYDIEYHVDKVFLDIRSSTSENIIYGFNSFFKFLLKNKLYGLFDKYSSICVESKILEEYTVFDWDGSIFLEFLIQNNNPKIFIEKIELDEYSLFDKLSKTTALERYIIHHLNDNNEKYFEGGFEIFKSILNKQSDIEIIFNLYTIIIKHQFENNNINSLIKYFKDLKSIIRNNSDPALSFYIPSLIKVFHSLNDSKEIIYLEREYKRRINIKTNPNFDFISVYQCNLKLFECYVALKENQKAENIYKSFFSDDFKFQSELIRLKYSQNVNNKEYAHILTRLRNEYEERKFSKSYSLNTYYDVVNNYKEKLFEKRKFDDFLNLSLIDLKKPTLKTIKYRGYGSSVHTFFDNLSENIISKLNKGDLTNLTKNKSSLKSEFVKLKIEAKEIEYLISNSIDFKDKLDSFYDSFHLLRFDSHNFELRIIIIEILLKSKNHQIIKSNFKLFIDYLDSQKENTQLHDDIYVLIPKSRLCIFLIELINNEYSQEARSFINTINSLPQISIEKEFANFIKIDSLFNDIINNNHTRKIPKFYSLILEKETKKHLYDIASHYKNQIFAKSENVALKLFNSFDDIARKLIIKILNNQNDKFIPRELLYFISDKSFKFIFSNIESENLKKSILKKYLAVNYEFLETNLFNTKIFHRILKLNYFSPNSQFTDDTIERDIMAFYISKDPLREFQNHIDINLFNSMYNFKSPYPYA